MANEGRRGGRGGRGGQGGRRGGGGGDGGGQMVSPVRGCLTDVEQSWVL